MRTIAFAVLVFAIRGFSQNPQLHFSGEVSLGQEYRKDIGSALIFVLVPTDDGWNIRVAPKTPCVDKRDDWASVVNPPYRGRNATYLEPSHGVTAQEAVQEQYEVWFVRTCEDYKRESDRLKIILWPYSYSQRDADEALAKLGTSPMGKARLTILKSKVSRANQDVDGKNYGKIDWLSFRLDISPIVRKRDRPPALPH